MRKHASGSIIQLDQFSSTKYASARRQDVLGVTAAEGGGLVGEAPGKVTTGRMKDGVEKWITKPQS